jgi:hypothetical protein
MHSVLIKRMGFLETWFDALMLAFKLPVVILPVWLLVWYAFLPPFHAQTHVDHFRYSAAGDFATVASSLPGCFFLAAGVLIIGGLVQVFKFSRSSGGWNLGFGIFALIMGIILAACISTPWSNECLIEMTF